MKCTESERGKIDKTLLPLTAKFQYQGHLSRSYRVEWGTPSAKYHENYRYSKQIKIMLLIFPTVEPTKGFLSLTANVHLLKCKPLTVSTLHGVTDILLHTFPHHVHSTGCCLVFSIAIENCRFAARRKST